MTREDLAKRLNVSRNTLNNWEKEKPEPVKLIASEAQINETEKYLAQIKTIKDGSSGNNKFVIQA